MLIGVLVMLIDRFGRRSVSCSITLNNFINFLSNKPALFSRDVNWCYVHEDRSILEKDDWLFVESREMANGYIEAKSYKVVGRHRVIFLLSSMDDFDLEETGTANAVELLRDSAVSLYGYDLVRKLAMFVRTSPDSDLTTAAFLYDAQFRQAEFVYTVSFDQLDQLVSCLPQVEEDKIIFIFSTGRCGSTLISKFFELLPDCISLSEPDYAYMFLAIIDPEMRVKLLEWGTRLSCRAIGPRKGRYFALKYRSEVTETARVLMELFPRSKSVYLYRRCFDHFKSCSIAFQLFSSDTFMGVFPPERQKALWQYLKAGHGHMDRIDLNSPVDLFSLAWQNNVLHCKRLIDDGFRILCIRYEEIQRVPEAVFRVLLDFCALPADWLQFGLPALERDSQEGSELSRAQVNATREQNTPKPEHYKRIAEVLALNVEVPTSDYLLPGTFQP